MTISIRAAIAGAAIVVLCAESASALVRINRDIGGRVGTYIEAFAAVRDSGQRVMIDGSCLSACTMVLGLVPRERICVTPNALLGFHAAWSPDENGRPVRNGAATQVLMDIYPAQIRSWIARRGGLTSRMIYLRGRELTAMYPACTTVARSGKRLQTVAGGPARAKSSAPVATRAATRSAK